MISHAIALRSERAERVLDALGVYLWEASIEDDRLRIDDGARAALGIDENADTLSVSSLCRRSDVDDGSGLFDALRAAARDGGAFSLCQQFTSANGATRWWEVHGEAVAGASAADRVIAGWMRGIERSDPQRPHAEEPDDQWVRSHRAATIDRCADGVAHEFKNVLQIIHGYVSFAKKALPSDGGPAADLEQALVATDRASHVAHQLLATARSEDDDLAACDVNGLLSDMARFLNPIVGDEIDIAVDVPEEPIAVTGLEASIRQILVNLCLNARDAMPNGGRLLLRAQRYTASTRRDDHRGLKPGDYARLDVADNGRGVAAGDAEKLFDPFYTTKAERQGTGLGLTVVRQLAESAGGAVTASSEEGVGTTFSVYLPLRAAGDNEVDVYLPMAVASRLFPTPNPTPESVS